MKLDNTTPVWVTGGASGLGAACVSMARSEDSPVVIFDLVEDGHVNDKGASTIRTDVSDAAQVATAIEKALELTGTPKVLICCAGIAPASRTVSRKGAHDPDLFRKVIEVNLLGTFYMASKVAELMAATEADDNNERGVVINTASVAAFDGQIGQCAYAASKAAVAGMTLPLARDLASLGVRVCSIAPGIFGTPMLAGLPQDVQDSLAAQVPFPSRLGQPDEYASLAAHIISNQMLNGEVIRLDGAIRMGPR